MSTTALNFRGRDALLKVVEHAYAQPGGEALTHALRDGLCRLIKTRAVSLPEEIMELLRRAIRWALGAAA